MLAYDILCVISDHVLSCVSCDMISWCDVLSTLSNVYEVIYDDK